MTGSLRFRLPALFLLGIVLSGIVAALIALRLFQSYTRDQSFDASCAARPRARAALRRFGAARGRQGPAGTELCRRRSSSSRRATGSTTSARRCSPASVPGFASCRRRSCRPESRPSSARSRSSSCRPAQTRTYLAAAEPLRLEADAAPFGALVVAKPKTDLRGQWLPLVERLALAFVVGAAIAGILSLVPVAPDHGARAGAVGRDRRDRRRALRRRVSRRAAAARSAISPSASTRWRCGSPNRRSASATS